MKAKYSIIILAGGKGSRMQESTPKQYLLLGGKPIIMHSIERVDRIEDIDEIIIVCDKAYEGFLSEMKEEYGITTKVKFANAGDTRQESVFNGLKAVSNKNVIIHEAARPFVKQSEFQALIDEESPNTMFGYNIPFTVVKGDEAVTGILNRNELVNVQLPQKYQLEVIRDAYEKALKRNEVYTEDASLVFDNSDDRVKIIKGSNYNLKITEPIDLLIGEIIYKNYFLNRI